MSHRINQLFVGLSKGLRGATIGFACLILANTGEANASCASYPIAFTSKIPTDIVVDTKYDAQVDYSLVLKSTIFNEAPSTIDGYSHGGTLADGSLFSFDFRHSSHGPVIAPLARACRTAHRQTGDAAVGKPRDQLADAEAASSGRTIQEKGVGTFRIVPTANGLGSEIHLSSGTQTSRIAKLGTKIDTMSVQPGSSTDLLALDLFVFSKGKVQWTHVRFLRKF